MQITITPRLYLRELTADDAQNFYELNLNPDVMQFTGDSVFESPEAARVFLANYGHYKKYGFGRWAVIHKEDEAFLGWCGLKYTEDTQEYDLGFRFFKKYRNQGYATEAVKACLEIGFTKFNMPAITSRIMEADMDSVSILEKAGFTYHDTFDFDGEDGAVYRITHEEYL